MLVSTSFNLQGIRKLSPEAYVQPVTCVVSLKQIDIEFMRRLHTKVNLIPVIAKADTMTDEEIAEFKERVRKSCLLTTQRLLNRTYRFCLTSLTTISTFSKLLHTTTRTKKPLLKQKKLQARFPLQLLAQIRLSPPQMAEKSVAAHTPGVLLRSTTRSIVISSNFVKCSSGHIWKS